MHEKWSALILAAVLACSGKSEKASPPADKGARPEAQASEEKAAPATTPATAEVAAAKPAEPATPAQRFIARWAETQNQSDLAAYEALYSKDFFGIRRAGKKTKRFERDEWLKDRARMFTKRMRVEVADFEEAPTEQGDVVTFTQVWESGAFKDGGKKRIQLRRTTGSYEITQEEMLTSERLEVAKRPDPNGPKTSFLVIGDPPVIVTDAGLPDAAAKGDPVLLTASPDGEDIFIAGKKIAPADAAEAKQWLGRKLRIYGENGLLCTAKVAALYNASVVWPDSRNGHFMYEEGDPQRTAKNAWNFVVEQTQDMADPELFLSNARQTLATLEPAGIEACKGGLWADDAAAPSPRLLHAKPASPDLLRMAKRAIVHLKGYRKDWDKADEVEWSIRLLVGEDGSEFLVAGLLAAVSPCDFGKKGGSIAAIWKVATYRGKPRLVLWSLGETLESAPVTGFFASDGEPRFVTAAVNHIDSSIWGPVGAVHRPVDGLGAFIVTDAEMADCPDEDDEGESEDEDE